MVNKKTGLVALLMVSVLATMSSANAADVNNKVFVGFDAQYVHLTPSKSAKSEAKIIGLNVKKDFAGLSLFGGYRWDQVALELGITGMSKANYTASASNGIDSVAAKLKQTNYNVYLDGVYFYPLSNNLELKGLVGVGRLTNKSNATIAINGSITERHKETKSRLGLRLGAGLQYNFSDHWSSSIMYKYQMGNSSVSNMHGAALGLAYHF